MTPTILLTSSVASVKELPRRIAAQGKALAGLYPLQLLGLARRLAEADLLKLGLRVWNRGYDALLARRLIESREELRPRPEAPWGPIARLHARTLGELRRAGVMPDDLERAIKHTGVELDLLAELYRTFFRSIEDQFTDPARILRAACESLPRTAWLKECEVLVADALELSSLEERFLEALAQTVPVRFVPGEVPSGLRAGSFAEWAEAHHLKKVASDPLLMSPPSYPEGLERLRTRLFEPPEGEACKDGSVELLTAAGEAAEARAIVRRVLREANRGTPFEDMAIIVADPTRYAPLFTDLLSRLGIPHRLHPSLPLRYGRASRSLELLFRCRGLERSAVMEFLTFAQVPFQELVGASPRTAQWDLLSREAQIVSGLDRWKRGLEAYASAEGDAAHREENPDRRARREQRVSDAGTLLRIVQELSSTLDRLSDVASWPEWSEKLLLVLKRWIAGGSDLPVLEDLVLELGDLGLFGGRVPWGEVEEVILSRLEWERLPMDSVSGGAVHIGALDALSGVPFRIVAIPGLGEGVFPPVLRPDPLLGDLERAALAAVPKASELPLFPEPLLPALSMTQDRLKQARRRFHRAVCQAKEHLILSYPRADSRSGRERMPSVFFVAAASALEGRPLSGADVASLLVEDNPSSTPLEIALDRAERDLLRLGRSKREEHQIAAGSVFFRQSRLASNSRWSPRLTPFDGLVAPLPAELAKALDPIATSSPVSASRLATFSRCGFMYFLQHVLKLQPDPEPEERIRLLPIERGRLFHEVAETFLRERRDKGELPVQDSPIQRARLAALADKALDSLVEGSPPRFTLLWQKERRRFHETLGRWLERESALLDSLPAYFEVSFGPVPGSPGEPSFPEPLKIDLEDGRTLLVNGRIDRIDRLSDGGLVLRDYKTGKAPKDDGTVFQGGKQLQMSFYTLAATRYFPDSPVRKALLDYVDGGREVSVDLSVVTGESFRLLLRSIVDAIAQGVFVQEPTSCDFCDFTGVCGPKGLLERRRDKKRGDRLVKEILRLRSVR